MATGLLGGVQESPDCSWSCRDYRKRYIFQYGKIPTLYDLISGCDLKVWGNLFCTCYRISSFNTVCDKTVSGFVSLLKVLHTRTLSFADYPSLQSLLFAILLRMICRNEGAFLLSLLWLLLHLFHC